MDVQASVLGMLMARSNGNKCQIQYVLIKFQEVFISLVQAWEGTLQRLHFCLAGKANDPTPYSFIVFQMLLLAC